MTTRSTSNVFEVGTRVTTGISIGKKGVVAFIGDSVAFAAGNFCVWVFVQSYIQTHLLKINELCSAKRYSRSNKIYK